jgi:hypothetical protein
MEWSKNIMEGNMTITNLTEKSTLEPDQVVEITTTYDNLSVTRTLEESPKAKTSLLVRKNSDVLAVIFMQFIVLAIMILLTMQYSWLHNVPHILSPLFGSRDIASFTEAIAKYDFVGVSQENPTPSVFAVVLEVAIWSLAGVLARSEFYLSQIVVKKKQFNFFESTSKLISDASMGIAIAIAVVLFLRAMEFVGLSLQNANVATIAAISFILGFYHEDTRRLLGGFRMKISQTTKDSKDAID